jgi:hypothetical protein
MPGAGHVSPNEAPEGIQIAMVAVELWLTRRAILTTFKTDDRTLNKDEYLSVCI